LATITVRLHRKTGFLIPSDFASYRAHTFCVLQKKYHPKHLAAFPAIELGCIG